MMDTLSTNSGVPSDPKALKEGGRSGNYGGDCAVDKHFLRAPGAPVLGFAYKGRGQC